MKLDKNIQHILSCLFLCLFFSCTKKVNSDATPKAPINPGAATTGTTTGSNTGDDEYPTDDDAPLPSSSSSSSISSSSSSSQNYSCNMGSTVPDNGTTSSNASFTFACNCPSTSTYQCRMGTSASWGSCNSSTSHQVSGLSAGAKRFEMRARFTNGNTCASTFYEWTIAAAAANVYTTVLDSTRSLSPLFIKMNFTTSGGYPPRSSECRISGDSVWYPCSTPWTPPQGTDPGSTYTFSVRTRDANNNLSLTHTRNWTNGNWPPFPAEPALNCGQSIVHERLCNQPTPSVFNNSSLLTGLHCQGDRYKSYTRTCSTLKIVAQTYQTTVGNLRTWNQDCSPEAPQSLDFRDAIMKFCSADPYWHSGWGPVYIEAGSTINAGLVKATCYTSNNSASLSVSDAALTNSESSCVPSSNANSYACHMAAHRYCRNLGHAAGFGPTRRASGTNQIVCMKNNSGQMLSTSIATLQNYNPSCVASDPLSIDCKNAAHYFCRANTIPGAANYSGMGLYNLSGSTADVYCVHRERAI